MFISLFIIILYTCNLSPIFSLSSSSKLKKNKKIVRVFHEPINIIEPMTFTSHFYNK